MDILFQAFVLGIVGGILPGPVLSMLLVTILQGGLTAGIRAFALVLLSELVTVGTLLFLATRIPINPEIFSMIGIAGGFVLLYFAWNVFQLRAVRAENAGLLFTPLKILLLQGTNATLYVFWITICLPLIWELALRWPLSSAATSFFLVFEVGWSAATFAVLLIFAFSRQTLTNERLMHAVFVLVAIILATFGTRMILTAMQVLQ